MNKTTWSRSVSLPALPDNSAADTPLRPFLWRLVRGENLTEPEAGEFMLALLNKERSNPEQIAAALVALAAKGETAQELAGMARVMQERATRFDTRNRKFIDLAGTGSSAAKTFNVSTAAALVAAGAGASVAKHSNRRVSSSVGSVEVLEELGVRVSYRKEDGGEERARSIAEACFNGVGLCFLSASAYHAEMNQLAGVRAKLGLRTSFNLLGILANPARPPFQIVGVWHQSLLEPMAEALQLLGVKRAWVVYGADGLDEITIAGETHVVETNNGKISSFTVAPEDFGVATAALGGLRAHNAAASAEIINDVLSGKRRDEARALVVVNAAAALVVSGVAKNPLQGARLAEQSLDSDAARIKLQRIVMTTNK